MRRKEAKFTIAEFVAMLETVKPLVGCVDEKMIIDALKPCDEDDFELEPTKEEADPVTMEKITAILDRFTYTDPVTRHRSIPVEWKQEIANAFASMFYKAGI